MSEYLAQISKLSPQQRFKMMDLGLNPLNPEHIQRFKSGNTKSNYNENVEWIKSIIPAHELNKDLGHGKHRDMDPKPGEYTPSSDSSHIPQQSNNQIRQNLMEEMDDMVETVAKKNNQMSSNLLSLKQNLNQPTVNNQSNNKMQEAIKVGKTRSTNFHNSYIKCLQNPNTNMYMEVYKNLKIMLEQEQKLLNSPLLPGYKKGINEVTSEMYNKLTQSLND